MKTPEDYKAAFYSLALLVITFIALFISNLLN